MPSVNSLYLCVQTTDAGGDRTTQGGSKAETCREDDG